MTCRLTLGAVLFAFSSLMAQSDPHQAGIASKAHSKDSKDVTVQGCVAISFGGSYVLMQFDPGNTYELEKGSRKIKLAPHLGEHVEVTGWERPSLSTSSDIFSRIGPASSVTIVVTSIRTIEKRCTATGEAGASPVAAPDSGTQLQKPVQQYYVEDGGATTVNQRRIARDSEGRIYMERWYLLPKDGKDKSQMTTIQISDPSSHTRGLSYKAGKSDTPCIFNAD